MSFEIQLVCPKCGMTHWEQTEDMLLKCVGCASLVTHNEMLPLAVYNSCDIAVRIGNASIVAYQSPDPEYPGIDLMYRTEEGTLIDLVVAKAHPEDGYKDVHLYLYEDVYTEDYTRKIVIRRKDIMDALGEF